MERRAPRVPDAVHRPDAAVLREVRRVLRGASPACRRPSPRPPRARAIAAFAAVTTSGPPGTASDPPGSAKSFWTSTTTSAVVRDRSWSSRGLLSSRVSVPSRPCRRAASTSWCPAASRASSSGSTCASEAAGTRGRRLGPEPAGRRRRGGLRRAAGAGRGARRAGAGLGRRPRRVDGRGDPRGAAGGDRDVLRCGEGGARKESWRASPAGNHMPVSIRAMFLRQIQIRGFKTFADKTVLEFTPGVSVIVGPNGSGKSNLVDAISWVLGEQGPRALRGGQMADVIFAGTPSRAALGMAEVKLVIDNAAGLIPVPMSEIEISRTIFRSGESEYRIGGQLVPAAGRPGAAVGLRDRPGAPHGRRAGPAGRGPAVEAGGPAALHRGGGRASRSTAAARSASERKLAGLDQDVLRLSDVLTELRRQLKPLQQQAEMATKHEALTQQAEDLARGPRGRAAARAAPRARAPPRRLGAGHRRARGRPRRGSTSSTTRSSPPPMRGRRPRSALSEAEQRFRGDGGRSRARRGLLRGRRSTRSRPRAERLAAAGRRAPSRLDAVARTSSSRIEVAARQVVDGLARPRARSSTARRRPYRQAEDAVARSRRSGAGSAKRPRAAAPRSRRSSARCSGGGARARTPGRRAHDAPRADRARPRPSARPSSTTSRRWTGRPRRSRSGARRSRTNAGS